ncbi:MAG TPA: hypothetical protein VHC69_11960 [Polyangiaceae bacterium]|nr:hypothetical protein [Polyangiaceae bacterium]
MLVALLFMAAPVRAADGDPAAAEELFSEGRAAMDRGDFAAACARFQESQRLDPAAGTLMNWAECLNRQGKPASARLKWREALDTLAPDDDRRAAAQQRVLALDAVVPRLEIRLDASVPPGARVARDGAPVDPVTLGLPVPVDPGIHRIEVNADGHMRNEVVVTVAEREQRTITVSAGPPIVVASAKVTDVESSRRRGIPPGAWVAGGVGAASLLTGVTFGVLAIVEKGHMNDDCSRASGSLLCNQSGLAAAHRGQTYSTIANVTVPIGLFGLGLGGYILWSSSREDVSSRAARGTELHVASTF